MHELADKHPSAGSVRAGGFSLRRTLIVLAWLASLIALFYAVENWRGQRAWKNFQSEMAAKGEPLNLAAYIPPPVPDDQNFTMTPLLSPLLDYSLHGSPATNRWRDPAAFARLMHFGDAELQKVTYEQSSLDQALKRTVSQAEREQIARAMLDTLRTFDGVIEELRAASHRPYARFNVHYEEGNSALLPYLALIKKFCIILKNRAVAELVLGDSQRAHGDILLGLHLLNTIRQEPINISQLVCIAGLSILSPTLWEAADRHTWSDEQWQGIQSALVKFDFFAGYRLAVHSEMNLATLNLEQIKREETPTTVDDHAQWLFMALIAPRGWLYQNVVTFNRSFFETVMPTMNAQTGRVFPKLAAEIETRWQTSLPPTSPYNILANFLLKMSTEQWRQGAPLKFAAGQTLVDQTRIVAALERHRLANQNYPETLDALSPRFIDKLPYDVFTGTPMKFCRNSDGTFLLYSVGWNETDDGGVTAMTSGKTPSPDRSRGDWVWGGAATTPRGRD